MFTPIIYTSCRTRRYPWKKNWKKILYRKHFLFFLAYNPPRPPMSVHSKFQFIRSSRLAGYWQHIYIKIFSNMHSFLSDSLIPPLKRIFTEFLNIMNLLPRASSNHESTIQILVFLQLCKGDLGFESPVSSSATSLLFIKF